MPTRPQFLTTGQAAHELGVSPKALRLYEEQGLLAPGRTRTGWRAYGPVEMERAREIISLRKLGLGLAEIANILDADQSSRSIILAMHQSRLASQMGDLGATLRRIMDAREISPVTGSTKPLTAAIAFDLPWPWGGERFSLPALPPLTYITGPLGSGKTRLAMRLAEVLPGGQFLGLDRCDARGNSYAQRLKLDTELTGRCDPSLLWLEQNGATISVALRTLVAAIQAHESPLVIDMVEQGLDHPSQIALAQYLRHRSQRARLIVLMTRSSAMLDLSLVESGETIIYCPANHSPPLIVHPDPLCPGYEGVATCLATPEVRARTAGVVAALLPAAQ